MAAFMTHPVPGEREIAATRLPTNSPDGYSAADFARATAFDGAIFWSDLAAKGTMAIVLVALLVSGMPNHLTARPNSKVRVWTTRLGFLILLFALLTLAVLPYRFGRFLHLRAFGLTPLDEWGWLQFYLLGLCVPFALFVFKYVLVICTLPLFQRRWWLAAALGVFVVFDVAPEIVSRTYPADPVETVRPLAPGPVRDAMEAVLAKARLDLPLRVADESRRSQSANICLTGRTGREYILLTDNFAREYSPAQAALALAHELGHFQRRTIALFTRLGTGLALLLATFGAAFLLTGQRALVVEDGPRVVVLTLLCGLVVTHALAPLSLAISRHEERLADRYALNLRGDGIEYEQLLVKVARHELTPLDLPRWRYWLGASHPTFLERMAAAGEKRQMSSPGAAPLARDIAPERTEVTPATPR